MNVRFLEKLRCPVSGEKLVLENAIMEGNYVRSGQLLASSGQSYEIRDFIPRFADDDYAESFSEEWEKHPHIIVQSKSHVDAYRKRFREETKWPDDLSGEIVLEAGCGPGGFTEFALATGADVVSFDLSRSVDITHRNVGNHEHHVTLQASIYDMPFEAALFDRIFCFGVLQHTPDPEAAFKALVQKLKPGGWIAVDSYVIPDPKAGGAHRILRAKYAARRIVPRSNLKLLHRSITTYVNAVWPFTRLMTKMGRIGRALNARFLIDWYEPRLPGLPKDKYKEFAICDIFDFLSPSYDVPQTLQSFRAWFEKAGLADIDVHRGYNGLEGRARKPRSG